MKKTMNEESFLEKLRNNEKEKFLEELRKLINKNVYFRYTTGELSGSIVKVNKDKNSVLIRQKDSKKIEKIKIDSIDRGSLTELKKSM